MPELKDRLKWLRKELKLSQTKFGEMLGVGIGVIRNFEDGLTVPNPAFIDLICRTYNCDRVWLETGEGEMFRKLSRDEQIADFVGKALADDSDEFVRQTIAMLAALDEAGWYKLEEAAKAIKEAEEKIKGS